MQQKPDDMRRIIREAENVVVDAQAKQQGEDCVAWIERMDDGLLTSLHSAGEPFVPATGAEYFNKGSVSGQELVDMLVVIYYYGCYIGSHNKWEGKLSHD